MDRKKKTIVKAAMAAAPLLLLIPLLISNCGGGGGNPLPYVPAELSRECSNGPVAERTADVGDRVSYDSVLCVQIHEEGEQVPVLKDTVVSVAAGATSTFQAVVYDYKCTDLTDSFKGSVSWSMSPENIGSLAATGASAVFHATSAASAGNGSITVSLYDGSRILKQDTVSINVPAVSAVCGNSTVETGEDCDDGQDNGTVCTPAYGSSCNYCDETCETVIVQGGYCGDGAVDEGGGEQCDDGNTTTEACSYGETSCTVCDATCQSVSGATSYCGDGITDTANDEQCDDGNSTSDDGCSSTCQTETLSVTAALSPTSGSTEVTFTLTCTVSGGTASSLEGRCDTTHSWSTIASGNTMECTYTAAGDYSPGCRVDGSVMDDMDSPVTVTESAVCGNSVVETGEACDDGNTTTESCAYGQTSCTVCDATCQNVAGATSYCGDSTTDSGNGEACDDGNAVTESCTYGQTSCIVCNATCQSVAGATS
ncbi:MAG TPA: hypothetical protein PLF13_14145, partial [candidate division Zixibacteria bacterium]|nr:hypothetical protein [candidate division Zixibacteria bacterium]